MIVKSKRPPQRVLTPQSCTPTQKSILNYVKPDNLDASPQPGCSRYSTPVEEVTVNMKPCVSCTRLTLEQVMAINSLASKKLLCYSGSFSKSVTHMIVATNAKGCVKDHTMKYVFAVAAGIWVLSFNWIEECLKRKCLVPEDPFEVKDVSGLPGPRLSRLALKRDLLKGFKVYAAKPFVSTTAEEVENVVTMLGGKIVSRLDDLLSRNGYIPLIITEARASQDFELYETWLETLRTVTVDLEWLSRSVGQYQLQNLRQFTLCSEDSICELGYPAVLTAEVTTSQSVTTIS
ncbi:breast cancer type 1 susceptibility protein homolog [Agrilus planipennis]|uniref:Breast cancer type 1 susceptibility protein homolog n=1 Tax=Agrilus planipennis TaxID=224129 RepID=A0A1W4XGE1_AGRPL|nr:breast cancer type 1 susceptibility protein homolog [Agrilus planipennis]